MVKQKSLSSKEHKASGLPRVILEGDANMLKLILKKAQVQHVNQILYVYFYIHLSN